MDMNIDRKLDKREWRWWEDKPEKLTKLEEAYLADMTDREACQYTGITERQLYYYQEITPEFVTRKHLLKQDLRAKAKLNLAKDIRNADQATTKWYLERKNKDEFSLKQEFEHSGDFELDIKDGSIFIHAAQNATPSSPSEKEVQSDSMRTEVGEDDARNQLPDTGSVSQ